jgi:hypothetical protein
LERGEILGREFALRRQVIERLAQEPCRADSTVIDAFPDFGVHHLDDGTDEGARGVILATVTASVPHVLDLGFVEMGKLVLLRLGAEPEFINVINDLPQIVAALDPVLDLAEDFPDLVFDGVRPGCLGLEAVQVGEEFAIDEG